MLAGIAAVPRDPQRPGPVILGLRDRRFLPLHGDEVAGAGEVVDRELERRAALAAPAAEDGGLVWRRHPQCLAVDVRCAVARDREAGDLRLHGAAGRRGGCHGVGACVDCG